MYDARAAELFIVAAALVWAVFECWQRRRYKDIALGILVICFAIGAAALALYEP